jgi:hypothetical protein
MGSHLLRRRITAGGYEILLLKCFDFVPKGIGRVKPWRRDLRASV